MSEPAWSLHPQLAINDADYPWLVLVPRRAGACEIADLGDDAARLMAEIVQVSRLLKDLTRCDKLNIGAIGNVVPQLHVHIVGRRKHDPLWPKPVWGATQRAGEPVAFGRFLTAIRDGLGPDLSSPAKAGEGDHP
jgi:diadenosine tetraphosphate (Ap4A) HIT family hydrolase